MKRIFLTSGLILCMACPAFADLDANGNVVGTDPAEAADCTEPTLAGTTGTSTFTALWNHISHQIDLNVNSATNYGAPSTSGVSPTVLFSEYGQNGTMYWTRTGSGTAQDPFYYSSPITQGTTDVISNDPVGKQVTLTFDTGMGYVNTNYNTGSDYTVDQTTDSENRPFNGFWASATTENTGELYIGTNGTVTQEGYAAATASNVDQTWYAHYSCAAFGAPNNPTKTGYTFGGWYEDSNLQTIVTNWCKDDDDTVYAKWTPTTGYSITYNCGTSGDVTHVPSAQQNLTYDQTYTLAANTCIYAGRTFVGWKCDYNIETGEAYAGTAANFGSTANNGAVSVVFRSTNNVTCTAMWEENTIGLTWMADTGNGQGVQDITTEGTNDECTYGGSITLPTTPERPGYEFAGWEVVNTPAGN